MTVEQEKSITRKIKNEYEEGNPSKFGELMDLNKKVHAFAEIFALVFGVAGALVLGLGMCLAMKVIFDAFTLGILIGCVGILMVSVNYPVYKSVIKRRKAKYASRIIALSNEILADKT